ncbi:MAG: hypothetical protein R3272_16370, partial [Candidatus Promineifilaceae bacterium]|nr:hypothetical protein [Candidatus Promineifilaceae bacterium]
MKKILFLLLIATLSLLVAGLAAGPTSAASPPHSSGVPANANVVELTAHHLEFKGPTEIPSGWTTVRLKNESEHVHFALFARYPEGRGVEDHQQIIAPIFQEGSELLWAGQLAEAFATFGQLPAWYFDVVITGGPGLIAPGRTAQTTLYLEPGTYVIECYVKTDRVYHSVPSNLNDPEPSEYGMVHEITVTETPSGASAPEPTLEMTLSTERGIEVADKVRPGLHTVAVYFEDQTVYGNFAGHDVHLARLES